MKTQSEAWLLEPSAELRNNFGTVPWCPKQLTTPLADGHEFGNRAQLHQPDQSRESRSPVSSGSGYRPL